MAAFLAVSLAAAPAAHAYGRNVHVAFVTKDAAHEAGEDIAIGLGITTGVLAVVGGALWYYFHNRHASAAHALPPPPDGSLAPSN